MRGKAQAILLFHAEFLEEVRYWLFAYILSTSTIIYLAIHSGRAFVHCVLCTYQSIAPPTPLLAKGGDLISF